MRLLAQTKSKLSKREHAIELFKKVIELNPRDSEAYLEIASLLEFSD